MTRGVARLFRPFLPEATRRVEELARELERAREESREAYADAEVDALHRAVAARVAETEHAHQRETEARRAADAADEYQREFLLAMSHEVRTPLNAIQGFARVLLDEIDGPLSDEERLDVESIHEAGAHLMDLLRDFLSLVGDRSSRPSFQEAPFSGFELLQEIARLGRGLTRSSAIRVVVAETPEDILFLADRAKIRQALVNIVSNAVKFTREGQVSIALARAARRRGTFVVEDSGPGMDVADLDRVRGEFVQSHDESSLDRGSGLGLAIVERIVRASGGELRIESGKGAGTRVEVELPCAEASAP
jgi:signal transduction histidine kinase